MGTMATSRTGSVLLFTLLAVACSTPDTRLDLAHNDRLYVDAAFHARSPGDCEVFVAPVVDARDPSKLPGRDGQGFPMQYGADAIWERPVPEMVGEVLEREIAASAVFAQVAHTATATTRIVQPRLVAFLIGAVERVEGAQAFAEVGIELQVLGPAGADGARPVLWKNTFGERQITPASMRPTSPYLLAGTALRSTMQKALVGLDASNVGRSHVPTAVDASTPAR